MGNETVNKLIPVPKASIPANERINSIQGRLTAFTYAFSAPPVSTAMWDEYDWDLYITQWFIK